MKAIVDLTVIPLGVGVSLARYVAACHPILEEAGLTYVLHANGTNIEGEWGAVFAAVERCHQAIHALGAPRVFTSLTVSTRSDRDQSMDDKLASLRAELTKGG